MHGRIARDITCAIAVVLALAAWSTRAQGQVTVVRHASPPPGSVNSYVIIDGEAAVVVDAQRTLSQARDLVTLVRAIGKPVRAILLTHAHPDHFGGLGALRAAFPDAPIVASPTTVRSMETDEEGLIAASRRTLGAEFSDPLPIPDRTVADGEALRFGGIEVHALEMGEGEASGGTVFRLADGRLVIGDLVSHRMVPYLLEKRSCAWLGQLERASSRLDGAATAFPGHGETGPLGELLAFQRDYLSTFRDAVRRAVRDEPDPAETEVVRASMRDAFPQVNALVAAVPDLFAKNVAAVAEEMRGQDCPADRARAVSHRPGPGGADRR